MRSLWLRLLSVAQFLPSVRLQEESIVITVDCFQVRTLHSCHAIIGRGDAALHPSPGQHSSDGSKWHSGGIFDFPVWEPLFGAGFVVRVKTRACFCRCMSFELVFVQTCWLPCCCKKSSGFLTTCLCKRNNKHYSVTQVLSIFCWIAPA